MPEYIVYRGELFANEFESFPVDQQDKILDFVDIYEEHGLTDFNKYEGKISPSWSGLDETHPNFIYSKENYLWHYHIGIPEYLHRHDKYCTSDVVLHFQWPHQGNEITIVDVYDHYTRDGEFYLPSKNYLK